MRLKEFVHTHKQLCTLQRVQTVFCHDDVTHTHTAQLITDPPRNTTTALGTNATFTCRGNGEIMWEISNTQIQELSQLDNFAAVGIYPSLPTQGFSELIMTGTTGDDANNVTRAIQCIIIDPNNPLTTEDSGVVRLLVYGEYFFSDIQCRVLLGSARDAQCLLILTSTP